MEKKKQNEKKFLNYFNVKCFHYDDASLKKKEKKEEKSNNMLLIYFDFALVAINKCALCQ